MTTRYYRPRAAAEYLGVSTSYLAKRRVEGDGPAFSKFGKAVAYSQEALDGWAASRARNSTSEDKPAVRHG